MMRDSADPACAHVVPRADSPLPRQPKDCRYPSCEHRTRCFKKIESWRGFAREGPCAHVVPTNRKSGTLAISTQAAWGSLDAIAKGPQIVGFKGLLFSGLVAGVGFEPTTFGL